MQSVLNRFEVFGRHRQRAHHFGLEVLFRRLVTRSNLLNDLGPIERAAIGDSRKHHGHLQRRGLHVALTDRHVDSVAGQPRFALILIFPFGIRNQAGHFDDAVDTRRRAKSEAAREPGQDVGVDVFEFFFRRYRRQRRKRR